MHPHSGPAGRGTPFDALHDEDNGVPHLRRAWRCLLDGDGEAALAELVGARRLGEPTEAQPHARVLEGLALVHAGQLDEAATVLRDSWREYPDVCALPAALGAALRRSGHHDVAAQVLHAALLTEDPDGSLAVWRPLLSRVY